MTTLNKRQIAYRCPDCAVATVGFLSRMGSEADMLRLKCSCKKSSLDIKPAAEGKVHLSVPCVYCKDTHGYTLSRSLLTRDEETRLSCPFSGMDIAFIGTAEEISKNIERASGELSNIMTALEAEEVKDIQPSDYDVGDAPIDPAIYDTLNFVVRDLEEENKILCPCNKGKGYVLRFSDEGMQLSCPDCGATYVFYCRSGSAAEQYLSLDEIKLS